MLYLVIQQNSLQFHTILRNVSQLSSRFKDLITKLYNLETQNRRLYQLKHSLTYVILCIMDTIPYSRIVWWNHTPFSWFAAADSDLALCGFWTQHFDVVEPCNAWPPYELRNAILFTCNLRLKRQTVHNFVQSVARVCLSVVCAAPQAGSSHFQRECTQSDDDVWTETGKWTKARAAAKLLLKRSILHVSFIIMHSTSALYTNIAVYINVT